MAYSENGIRMAPFETFSEHSKRAWSDEPYNEDFIKKCREKAVEYDNEDGFTQESALYQLELCVPMHYRAKVLEGTRDLSRFKQHLKDINFKY